MRTFLYILILLVSGYSGSAQNKSFNETQEVLKKGLMGKQLNAYNSADTQKKKIASVQITEPGEVTIEDADGNVLVGFEIIKRVIEKDFRYENGQLKISRGDSSWGIDMKANEAWKMIEAFTELKKVCGKRWKSITESVE
ncbi:hypothetical protein [Ferruginibacter sp. HRS2-29]|uniref:hypothetical protein n=1 Tax=Ferruginibacter sp. HRS2-29 TaxID=2487334 RepID=UPI0020CF2512|nr:hypothetical protein [Ferruginibacter sp. HRS2-29]MCP9751158.1 hypothetical protein [Ferruginibacter sp. HRS2-29]